MKVDLGLLFFRAGVSGVMAFSHGLPKLMSFSEKASLFPDPLGVGSSVSLGLTIFAEFVCALLVLTGIFAREACIPLVITMGVAAFHIHSSDPFAKKELSLIYLISFLALFLTGPGAFSIGKGKLRIGFKS